MTDFPRRPLIAGSSYDSTELRRLVEELQGEVLHLRAELNAAKMLLGEIWRQIDQTSADRVR